ncbi:hypothetical protein J2046_002056 [Rhizobium petrolearium]|nr:hypothetical protein [Neorhizobium petrolearium]
MIEFGGAATFLTAFGVGWIILAGWRLAENFAANLKTIRAYEFDE